MLRPEIIIPIAGDVGAAGRAKVSSASGLTAGSPVRIIREPGFGRLGSVKSLPPEALAGLRSSRRLQQRSRALRHWRQELGSVGGWDGLPEAGRLALCSELEADLPALLLLLPQSAGLLERWRLQSDPLFHPAPPLDGLSLQQELAIPPGRLLGRLLAHLTHERAFGRLVAGPEAHAEARAEVLAAAQSWWQQHAREGGEDRRRD